MRVEIIVDTRRVNKSSPSAKAEPCRGCVGEFSPPLCTYLGDEGTCADHIFIATDAKKAKLERRS